MLNVKHIENSFFRSITYILSNNTGKIWLVDCGDVEKVLEIINPDEAIEGVLLTHTHADHIYGLQILQRINPDVLIVTNDFGGKALFNPQLNFSKYHADCEDIVISNTSRVIKAKEGDTYFGFKVYETPGHDPSCLTFARENFLFTGDSYIPGVNVFCGFPNSDKNMAEKSREKIIRLAKGKIILPGHVI